MNSSKKYLIAVDIKTTAPLHITAVEKGSYDSDSGKLSRYPASGGMTTTLTRTAALADYSRYVQRAGTNGNGTDTGAGTDDNSAKKSERIVTPVVPTITAATLASQLRHASVDLMLNSMIERGFAVTPDAYNMLNSGQASMAVNSDKNTFEVARAARMDPFLCNFGGTSFMLAASSVISEALPLLAITQSKIRGGIVAEELMLALDRIDDMTSVVPVIRKNDIQSMRDTQRLADAIGVDNVAAYLEKCASDQAASKDNKEALKAQKEATKAAKLKGETLDPNTASVTESKKVDLRNYTAIEVVRTGMPFALRAEVVAHTPAHLGLMLLAMQRFLIKGQVGGKAARGYGSFVGAKSCLIEIDPATGKHAPLYEIYGNKSVGYDFEDRELIGAAVGAAQKFINKCDPMIYEAFSDADFKKIKALTQGSDK